MQTTAPKCSLFFVALFCALAAGCQTTGQNATPSIAGTRWQGTADNESFRCEFESSGQLHYESPSGDFRNGTWRQRDAQIYLEMNKRYAEYFGSVAGSQMHGTARNIKHHKWTWHLNKAK